MEDEDIAPNTNSVPVQLIQSVWAESRASALYIPVMCTGTT